MKRINLSFGIVIAFSISFLASCDGTFVLFGASTPVAKRPDVSHTVAPDNSSITIQFEGGDYDTLHFDFCGVGAIGDCRSLIILPADRKSFVFTALHIAGQPPASASNVLITDTDYHFDFQVVKTNSRTGVSDFDDGDALSIRTWNADGSVSAIMNYYEVSHTLAIHDDEPYDWVEAIKNTPGQMEGHVEFTRGLLGGGMMAEVTFQVLRSVFWDSRFVRNSSDGLTITSRSGDGADAIECEYDRLENFISPNPDAHAQAIHDGFIGTNGPLPYFGHRASSRILEVTALNDEGEALNEQGSYDMENDGIRYFDFDSDYTEDDARVPRSYTPPADVIMSAPNGFTLICSGPLYSATMLFTLDDFAVFDSPAGDFYPTISNEITERTISYRVPRLATISKPSSATFDTKPATDAGAAPVLQDDLNDLEYTFRTLDSDSFADMPHYLLPELLWEAPLVVAADSKAVARYQYRVTGRYILDPIEE